jgi:hypothetical protein
MNENTFIILILIIWIFAIGYILYSKYMKKDKIKSVELSEEEIKTFHIFPDYPKDMPYECKSGEEFHFIVKGYTDIDEIREVPINGDKVIWDYTKGNGAFRGKRNIQTGEYIGDSIDYIAPDKENLIFISAHYLNFTDATWIKVIK